MVESCAQRVLKPSIRVILPRCTNTHSACETMRNEHFQWHYTQLQRVPEVCCVMRLYADTDTKSWVSNHTTTIMRAIQSAMCKCVTRMCAMKKYASAWHNEQLHWQE